MDGWPSKCVNYDYQIVKLSEAEFAFSASDASSAGQRTTREILADVQLGIEEVRAPDSTVNSPTP